MCGIFGAIVARHSHVREACDSALRALHHRGPDHAKLDESMEGDSKAILGHTRLSIIDLADEANQPMRSADGRFVLVFNGEIYNYIELREELRRHGQKFQTSSDTEVLLNAWTAWGEECLDKLDGMFAFAVLDRAKDTLTCVRDPFGIKPFFYALTEDAFYFASELPALVALRPGVALPNLQTAYDYLVHGDYDSSEKTFVDGALQLRPAHLMTIDVSTRKIESMRQWWAPRIEQTSRLTFSEATDAVRAQFLLNIKRQLRSDVPVGAALSGGIDSSAVVCAMRYLEPELPLHTFSFIASDKRLSEESWVDLVNGHVGAQAHKIYATAEDLAGDIDDVVRAQGEPFGSTSIYAQYRVYKQARESGITVTLDGQGADELLAGYNGYPGYRLLSMLSEGRGLAAWQFARAWRSWPGRSGKMMALDLARSLLPDAAYSQARALTGRSFAPAWLKVGYLREAGVRFSEARLKPSAAPRGRRLVQQLGTSLQHRGLPSLLRHGDRNSMRFSIESRVPFLTTDLCDLLYSFPENYLISQEGETKSIFRAAMRGIVPDAVLDRRDKVGFATPEYVWLAHLAPQVRTWLADGSNVPFLETRAISVLFEKVLAGQLPFNWQMWRLINYVRWWNATSAII